MSETLSAVSHDLLAAIRSSWDRDTSYEPFVWSNENPAWGQCAVTALVLQDYLGGDLIRASNLNITHFWNLVDDLEIDVTEEQFPVRPIWIDGPELVDRDVVLNWPETRRRYRILRERVAKLIASQ